MRFFRSAIAKRPSSYAWTRADLSPPEAYSNNWKAYCASNAPRTVVSGRVAIFINVCPLTSQLRRAGRQFGPTNLRGFGLWPRDVPQRGSQPRLASAETISVGNLQQSGPSPSTFMGYFPRPARGNN